MTEDGGRPARADATGLSRRALLTAAAAALPVLVTACKGVQALGTPPPPAPDVRILQAAISSERALVTRYAASLKLVAADATVHGVLQSVHAEHVAHLAQLESRLTKRPGPTASVSASPSPSGAAGGSAAGLSGILAGLEHAEKTASDHYIAQLGALPPSLAQLFASIAASEATHVPQLRDARRGR